eukprot:3852498-Rhodomonas_salina.1
MWAIHAGCSGGSLLQLRGRRGRGCRQKRGELTTRYCARVCVRVCVRVSGGDDAEGAGHLGGCPRPRLPQGSLVA